ncbi:nonstructural protein [Flyfo microvirus Tbat2_163]|nr:nonstructural protein [Flyfo microvirus Tbat2_163]
MNLYVVFDCLAEESASPFDQPTDLAAMRAVHQSFSAVPSEYHSAYQLWRVASYDPDSLVVVPDKLFIGSVDSLFSRMNEQESFDE